MQAQFTDVFIDNIKEVTEDNNYYRRVLATTPNMQLVVMSLQPFQEIGMEVHPYNTQFIRVESGHGLAIIDDIEYVLYDDTAIVIPLNTKHNIINISSTQKLKLYTIYSPPHHDWNKIEKYKVD
jgi:mannose-6-phosphate isomerase-like protein (cupin superfamily)